MSAPDQASAAVAEALLSLERIASAVERIADALERFDADDFELPVVVSDVAAEAMASLRAVVEVEQER